MTESVDDVDLPYPSKAIPMSPLWFLSCQCKMQMKKKPER